MQATTNGTLADTEVKFSDKNACCVIMASAGYPQSYEKGFPMTIPAEIAPDVFVAGTKLSGDKLLTNGGRVLGATATADTLENAIKDAYKLVEQISFENAYYRHDIGARALLARKD
jgi:phosphoribosylamine--glycine ligase